MHRNTFTTYFFFFLLPGCGPLPKITPPLQVTLQPPENPLTAVYSCPPDYVLSGQAVSTCVSGKWSSPAPTCREFKMYI